MPTRMISAMRTELEARSEAAGRTQRVTMRIDNTVRIESD
jgi:hypothetical protein